MPSSVIPLCYPWPGMIMTFNKKAGNLVKKAKNIMKRKENAWILTKKQEFLLFPENSHAFTAFSSYLRTNDWPTVPHRTHASLHTPLHYLHQKQLQCHLQWSLLGYPWHWSQLLHHIWEQRTSLPLRCILAHHLATRIPGEKICIKWLIKSGNCLNNN